MANTARTATPPATAPKIAAMGADELSDLATAAGAGAGTGTTPLGGGLAVEEEVEATGAGTGAPNRGLSAGGAVSGWF